MRSQRIITVTFAGACCLLATLAFGQSTWTQEFPAQVPSGRSFHAMVYDEARNEVVLCGGIANNFQVLGDTWVWNGVTWIEKSPAASPAPRYGHMMAYDAARREVVLFGGLSGSASGAVGDETWVWNGTTWVQVFPATRPPTRDLAAMTYDPVRGETVLFGGRDLSSAVGSLLDDTWVWDGTDWTQKFPTAHPSARIEHAMAFDASHAEAVLFGGRLSVSPSGFADTWVWNGADWTERSPATSPTARGGHALAYDALRAQVILFGGYATDAVSRDDTWSWNGTDWVQLVPATSPPARTNHAMAYVSTLREIVLFSGSSTPGADRGNFNDTWTFEDNFAVPLTKDDCKRGGWTDLAGTDGIPFTNQGACIRFVNTGK